MKKVVIFAILPIVLIIAGCNRWKKTDLTNVDFGVESCNKYYEVIECILENEENDSFSSDDRNDLREEAKTLQTEWLWLDEDVLAETCDAEFAKFEAIASNLEKIWCSVE